MPPPRLGARRVFYRFTFSPSGRRPWRPIYLPQSLGARSCLRAEKLENSCIRIGACTPTRCLHPNCHTLKLTSIPASPRPSAGTGKRAGSRPNPSFQIGRAHVRTPVTNAHLVCRLLLEKKKKQHKERQRNINR